MVGQKTTISQASFFALKAATSPSLSTPSGPQPQHSDTQQRRQQLVQTQYWIFDGELIVEYKPSLGLLFSRVASEPKCVLSVASKCSVSL